MLVAVPAVGDLHVETLVSFAMQLVSVLKHVWLMVSMVERWKTIWPYAAVIHVH